MKITKTHIDDLYQFTRDHYVEHYDLQTELVDHLANDIETIWETEPKLSFAEARDRAFKKFGVFGFMEVVEQRQKAMNKRYMSLLWGYLKQWFRPPQLLFTLALVVVLYSLFSLEHYGKITLGVVCTLCGIWCFFPFIKFSRIQKRKKKNGEKRWLLEEIIIHNAGLLVLLIVPQALNILNLFEVETLSTTSAIISAAVVTLTVLYIHISTVVLPQNAEKHLKETYPEYAL